MKFKAEYAACCTLITMAEPHGSLCGLQLALFI